MILKPAGSELNICCSAFFNQWPERLLRRHIRNSEFDVLLLQLLQAYTPTAVKLLVEKGPLLINAVFCDCPFWGACESVRCPNCGRQLNAIIVDANMIILIDQFARQLVSIIDPNSAIDLHFFSPDQVQCDRADEILGALAFQTATAPLISRAAGSEDAPYCHVHEAKRVAWHFLLMHELGHLIPYAADEWVDITGELLQDLQNVELIPNFSERWIEELEADMNGLRTMISDSPRIGIRDSQSLNWCRCLVAGIGLNFIAWDFIEREYCHGHNYASGSADSTHPPIKYRLLNLLACSHESFGKKIAPTDASWMLRISTALAHLHAQPEWKGGDNV